MSKEFSKLHIRKMPIAQYPRYTQTTSTSNRTSLELKLTPTIMSDVSIFLLLIAPVWN